MPTSLPALDHYEHVAEGVDRVISEGKRSQAASSGATKKLPSWRPQGIPLDEDERKALRALCTQAVFSTWYQEHRPTQLSEIYRFVKAKITEKSAAREWPFSEYRGKRTIDRRVNEAACGAYSEDGVARIVAVTAGVYQPNPELFGGLM